MGHLNLWSKAGNYWWLGESSEGCCFCQIFQQQHWFLQIMIFNRLTLAVLSWNIYGYSFFSVTQLRCQTQGGSEMTYTAVASGTLNSTIPYRTTRRLVLQLCLHSTIPYRTTGRLVLQLCLHNLVWWPCLNVSRSCLITLTADIAILMSQVCYAGA